MGVWRHGRKQWRDTVAVILKGECGQAQFRHILQRRRRTLVAVIFPTGKNKESMRGRDC